MLKHTVSVPRRQGRHPRIEGAEASLRRSSVGFRSVCVEADSPERPLSTCAVTRRRFSVDGMTWQDYEADLELRIEDLHGRVHRGAYRPQPPSFTDAPAFAFAGK